jgi:hypothetical protein
MNKDICCFPNNRTDDSHLKQLENFREWSGQMSSGFRSGRDTEGQQNAREDDKG